MKRIYKVEYEQKFRGVGEWIADHQRVLANGDAQIAVDRVRKEALRDRGCTGFRLAGVEILADTTQ